jgi:acyl carrier protein
MDYLTFDEFTEWLREYLGIPLRKAILPETQFDRDLGVTGDDGADLLQAAEKRFEVTFTDRDGNLRETFKLQPNEYLFHSEGWGPSPTEITSWFSGSPTVTRKFTVGELFRAVQTTRTNQRPTPGG